MPTALLALLPALVSADPIALPDPLATQNGKSITTAAEWRNVRRPELVNQFQDVMYGQIPAPRKVRSAVEFTDNKAFDGKATVQEVSLRFEGQPDMSRPLRVLVIVPNKAKAPVPAFIGVNFCGNQGVLANQKIHLTPAWMYPGFVGVVKNHVTEAARGKHADVWPADQIIEAGFALVTFYAGEIAADDAKVHEGVAWALGLLKSPRGPKDTATIAAWAWGASRVLDYLQTRDDIDGKRVGVVGHSRLGKTALLAAAFDERFAFAIPSQAGCGGTAPNRGKIGESIKQINDRFPHWFADAFKEYNADPSKLPFDQNGLAAMMAPRPLLFSNAADDTWANPAGQFAVLHGAESVYKLLEVPGLGVTEMPASGKLVGDRLCFFIRPGKHSMTRTDWAAFIEFAQRAIAK